LQDSDTPCRENEDACLSLVMAGLVPAIHVLLCDGLVEVFPFRIARDDQSDFPCARPMLDIVFALDRILDRGKLFEVDKVLQAVLLCKSFDESGAVSNTRRTRSLVTPTYRMPFGRLVMK
jgi:hypothetical protein